MCIRDRFLPLIQLTIKQLDNDNSPQHYSMKDDQDCHPEHQIFTLDIRIPLFPPLWKRGDRGDLKLLEYQQVLVHLVYSKYRRVAQRLSLIHI